MNTSSAPNDLAVAKLVSGREKDLDWVQSGLRAGLFDPDTIHQRLDTTAAPATTVNRAHTRLRAMAHG